MIYYPIIPYHNENFSVSEVFGKRYDDFKQDDFIFYNNTFFRKHREGWETYNHVKNNKLNRKLYNFNTIFSDNKYLIISNNP